jgi:hypothetical protein
LLITGGQQIASRQVLSGEHPVHRFERELASIAQEIREMRLSKPGLTSQQRDAESAALYPVQQLNPQALVHLSKVHLWKIRHQAGRQTVSIFLQQSDLR